MAKKKAAAAKTKFPDALFVQWEEDKFAAEGGYVVAHRELNTTEDGPIAVYELVRVGTVTVSKTIG